MTFPFRRLAPSALALVLVLPPPAAAAQAAAAALPPDLSAWGMFVSADWVVKAVIAGLVAASLVSWTVLLAKSLELRRAAGEQRRALAAIENARSLQEAAEAPDSAASPLVAAALAEVLLSRDALHDAEGLKERVASRCERVEAALARRLTRGVSPLATISATAPFVGLFGTVWGIMHSFIRISQSQASNLAVVAPGIAEALLATAVGLVAAIPAVAIYNHFSRRIAACRALTADAAAAVLRLVSRDLSRGIADQSGRRAAAAE